MNKYCLQNILSLLLYHLVFITAFQVQETEFNRNHNLIENVNIVLDHDFVSSEKFFSFAHFIQLISLAFCSLFVMTQAVEVIRWSLQLESAQTPTLLLLQWTISKPELRFVCLEHSLFQIYVKCAVCNHLTFLS